MARIKIIPIALCLLEDMFLQGHRIIVEVEEGLPDGAELVNSYYDGDRQTVCLVYHHESFADIPQGGHYPEFWVTWRDLREDIFEEIKTVLWREVSVLLPTARTH